MPLCVIPQYNLSRSYHRKFTPQATPMNYKDEIGMTQDMLYTSNLIFSCYNNN